MCTLDRFVWFLQHVGVGKGLAISWRLADLHLLGPPLVVALGLQCFLYAVITTIQVHVSLFLYIFYEYICPKDSDSSLLTPFFFFLFFFFLKRFRYLYFYDCSVFTALYFSFIFWENSKDIAHLLFFNPPLTKKKKKWVRGERKKDKWNYFLSSILLFCNTYLEFLFLRLLTHFIIKISKPIRNMQWMVIYKHDKENKIGRGNCTACSAASLFINSDSSAPALIYFWWYKQDDFAVWYIFKFEYSR